MSDYRIKYLLVQMEEKDYESNQNLSIGDGRPKRPRFTADGRQILYNSNCSGYCNLYLADIPEDVTTLPFLDN